MQQQRPVETVEEFKLRIAAIIRAKPAQIPAAKRLRRLKRRPTRKQNGEPPLVMENAERQSYGLTSLGGLMPPLVYDLALLLYCDFFDLTS